AQPVYRSDGDAGFSAGHNGNLMMTERLGADLGMLPGFAAPGHGADSTSLCDLVASAVPREYRAPLRSDGRDLEVALERVLPTLEGAFSFVMMDEAHLVGVRDRHGFRPLVLGRLDDGWVVASETAALDIIGAHFVREIEPGEMVMIDANGGRSYQM